MFLTQVCCLEDVRAEMKAQARGLRLGVDQDAYHRARRDPWEPIVAAGTHSAPLCILGRDLGAMEVLWGQPLVGPAGQIVRRGLAQILALRVPPHDLHLETVLRHVLLANLMPYKPEKPSFPRAVRERFRPALEHLLLCYWQGFTLLALGTEALAFFARYDESVGGLAHNPRRFTKSVRCRLVTTCHGRPVEKILAIFPLPHPSPANARWKAHFPALLEKQVLCALAGSQ